MQGKRVSHCRCCNSDIVFGHPRNCNPPVPVRAARVTSRSAGTCIRYTADGCCEASRSGLAIARGYEPFSGLSRTSKRDTVGLVHRTNSSNSKSLANGVCDGTQLGRDRGRQSCIKRNCEGQGNVGPTRVTSYSYLAGLWSSIPLGSVFFLGKQLPCSSPDIPPCTRCRVLPGRAARQITAVP